MPKVGKKHFSYTVKGIAAAKAEAKRTGKKIGVPKPLFPAVKKKPTILTPKNNKKPKLGNL